ncbi:MAG TPA: hypothetical protein VF786_13635 [Terriglobales bacterium]
MLKTLWHRTYADFLMRDRLHVLERLLTAFLDAGYEFNSVLGFWQRARHDPPNTNGLQIVLRHDIDTDARTARRMWRLERSLGIASTYYFRLCTAEVPLMREIDASGCEASYHYEELASYAKQTGLRRREVLEALPSIRALFRRNLLLLRQRTGLAMRTVASHGDFVNRKLGLNNTILLTDEALRRELDIHCDAYDADFLCHIAARASDAMSPVEWNFNNPYLLLQRRASPLLLLIHPRQWHADAWTNLRDDTGRLWEGLRYGWASPLSVG